MTSAERDRAAVESILRRFLQRRELTEDTLGVADDYARFVCRGQDDARPAGYARLPHGWRPAVTG